jgi:rod shape-determining protein MreC
LDFKKTSPLKLVPAEVVGVDASTYFQSIIIDKGTAAGIRKDMAVISPRGVVGRILKVTTSFSMVILLIDQNFALDALVQRSRARGVVEGVGGSHCQMKYVLHSDDVRVNDLVIASGLEGVFPKGTIIGQIRSVKSNAPSAFKCVVVEPRVDFKKLEEVLVVTEG